MSINTSYHRRHHHTSVEDTKSQKILKYVLSFFVCILLTVLSVLICVKSVALNPDYLKKSFTSYEYTMELYKNIDDFAKASCKKANIGTYAVEKAVTFEQVKQINDSYICEKFKVENRFTNETYDYFIIDLKNNLKTLLLQQLESDYAEISSSADVGADGMVNDIIDYIDESVSVSHAEKLYSITAIADTALKIVSIVIAVLTAAVAVIICYIGEKKYRGLRYVSYSIGGSAVINLAFVIILNIIAKNMDLTLSPVYLQYALESHINNTVFALLCASIALFAVYTAILAVCWKLKRKNK